MSHYYGEAISITIEAAEIRRDQLLAVGTGTSPEEVIDELYEMAAEREAGGSDEAERIAHMQTEAIKQLREQLPAQYGRTGVDTLATNAMCIWEHVLNTQMRWKKHATIDEPLNAWIADGEGACSARDGCWALAGWAEWAFDRFSDDHDELPEGYEAFDWDFIPAFIDALYHVCSDRQISPKHVDEDYVRMAITAMQKS